MSNEPCVVIVKRLVPYHDARFSEASLHVNLKVIEVDGLNGSNSWSKETARDFEYVQIWKHGGTSVRSRSKLLYNNLNELKPKCIAIQGWADFYALVGLLWAVRNKAKVVIFSESNVYDHSRTFFKELYKKIYLHYCGSALVGGNGHMQYLQMLGFQSSKIFYGYNVVDNKYFNRNRGLTASFEERTYFLVVARLIEIKNIELILKAYSICKQGSKPFRFTLKIVGEGVLLDELVQLANQLGIGDSVDFLGFIKYEELPSLYSNAIALIHAATVEPWGLVVNEALASGLPVIVSDKCGCVELLVQHKINGYVFEPKKPAILSEYMSSLGNDPISWKSFSENSLKIISDYGPEAFSDGFRKACLCADTKSPEKGLHDLMILYACAFFVYPRKMMQFIIDKYSQKALTSHVKI